MTLNQRFFTLKNLKWVERITWRYVTCFFNPSFCESYSHSCILRCSNHSTTSSPSSFRVLKGYLVEVLCLHNRNTLHKIIKGSIKDCEASQSLWIISISLRHYKYKNDDTSFSFAQIIVIRTKHTLPCFVESFLCVIHSYVFWTGLTPEV